MIKFNFDKQKGDSALRDRLESSLNSRIMALSKTPIDLRKYSLTSLYQLDSILDTSIKNSKNKKLAMEFSEVGFVADYVFMYINSVASKATLVLSVTLDPDSINLECYFTIIPEFGGSKYLKDPVTYTGDSDPSGIMFGELLKLY